MPIFDNVKGYAYDHTINNDLIESKIKLSLMITSIYIKEKIDNILIAGCGKGDEAFAFYNLTSANVYGVDINAIPYSQSDESRVFEIKNESIDRLSFANQKFDFIYCYHVLGHVKGPVEVLKELKRVLSPSGILFIGFPNRRRLLPGYFFSHLNTSLWEIIKYNLYDYNKRLRGKFRNEFGAHAGFSERDFFVMSNSLFNHTISIRKIWVEKNYPKFTFLLKLAEKFKLADFFYPSNYFIIINQTNN